MFKRSKITMIIKTLKYSKQTRAMNNECFSNQFSTKCNSNKTCKQIFKTFILFFFLKKV